MGSSFGEFGTPTPQTPAHPASRAPKSFFVGKNVGKSAFKANKRRGYLTTGGDGGIRTLDALLAHTPLAGEHLRPLGHVS